MRELEGDEKDVRVSVSVVANDNSGLIGQHLS